jgi:hypothetical protein
MVPSERAERRPTWRPRWLSSPSAPADENARWESFDSLTLKNLGDNRYQVEISYETGNGKIEHRMFEGTREEIREDILVQQDLPANEREHLLRSLDVPGTDFHQFDFNFPGVYYTPDGQMIWDFGDPDSAF